MSHIDEIDALNQYKTNQTIQGTDATTVTGVEVDTATADDIEIGNEVEEGGGGDVDDDDDSPIVHIRIQNIVATISLGCRVDLDKIAQTARNAEFNPRRFQAVILRIREPRTTALIFSSGKMIVTGAKTEKDAMDAAKKYTAIVKIVGYPSVMYNDFKVQNITATCDCGFPIRLEAFIFAHSSRATYEPELFPGLVYRMEDPKVVLLIFVSGKLVLTGAKTLEALQTAFEQIYPILTAFRKRNVVIITDKRRRLR